MQKNLFNVVIVGHVDHGKSTLIGRLLHDTHSVPPDKLQTIRQACEEIGMPFEFAYITDQIREEREQGITIDTTQIYFHTDQRDYVIIDAPGHKEFMKNMITGASQAEGAVLVVDMLEGVREQTRRHAYILAFLGLKENIVVLNKMDLIGYSQDACLAVQDEMMALFASLGIPCTQFIPVSSALGDNIAVPSSQMPWYSGPTVIEALDGLRKRGDRTAETFTLPVQDVYHIDGEQIVAGRVESGNLRAGDQVLLLPGEQLVTVDGIREFGHERTDVECGECTGLVLAEPVEVHRGQMLAARGASLPVQTTRVHGTIFWMSGDPLRIEQDLIFRCNTQDAPCKVTVITRRIDSSTSALLEENAQQLYETEVGEVIIDTVHPVMIKPFAELPELGRFVLERGADIIAGGIISA